MNDPEGHHKMARPGVLFRLADGSVLHVFASYDRATCEVAVGWTGKPLTFRALEPDGEPFRVTLFSGGILSIEELTDERWAAYEERVAQLRREFAEADS